MIIGKTFEIKVTSKSQAIPGEIVEEIKIVTILDKVRNLANTPHGPVPVDAYVVRDVKDGSISLIAPFNLVKEAII